MSYSIGTHESKLDGLIKISDYTISMIVSFVPLMNDFFKNNIVKVVKDVPNFLKVGTA